MEVDNFITAQDVKSYKPNKEHWMEFFRKTGSKKEDVIHIANSVYHDIVPANELGIRTVWVNRYGEKDPSNTKPDFTVTNLSRIDRSSRNASAVGMTLRYVCLKSEDSAFSGTLRSISSATKNNSKKMAMYTERIMNRYPKSD